MNPTFNPYEAQEKDLYIFDVASLLETEKLAAGLSEEEVLDYFAVNRNELSTYPKDEAMFKAAFKRGRSIAKMKACGSLFTQMNERGGANASIAYLRQFGEMWPTAEVESGLGKNFSFKVVLGEDD